MFEGEAKCLALRVSGEDAADRASRGIVRVRRSIVRTKQTPFVVVLAVASAVVFHCAGGTTADTPAGRAATASSLNASALVDALRGAGLGVRDAGTVTQPFFSVPARVYVVEDRDLQIYEFASPSDAEQAAAQVSPAGSPIGTTMVTWMAPPHFFRKGRLIVNYIGTSEKVLAELQRLMGAQFAGR
jgi:hypothetical protein